MSLARAAPPAVPVAPSFTELAARPDEVTAVSGARWITAASLSVGALNYGYALLLTRLLDVDAFATFAAGQGLLLCAATVAVVAIPWVLAQTLARATSPVARADAVRVAVLIAVAGGTLAAALVATVAAQFAGAPTTLVLAAATLLIYVTRVTVGWLQGTERMRTLAGVTTSEAILKIAVGLLLVSALGLSDTGALAAFGIAVLPFLIWWPRRAGTGRRSRLHATADHDLWRRAAELGAIQGLVALMAGADLVLVALLPAQGTEAASYQASVMVGRAPLFLAGAISLAFFPALSRRRAGNPLASNALRMYLIVALPLTAVCATAPPPVLNTVFPAGYDRMSSLLAFTAISGFAIGGINLLATFFQAVNDRSCLRRQGIGLLLFTVALLVGWRVGGILGVAIGGTCGTVTALLLLAHRLVRAQGFAVFTRLPLAEPLLVIGALLVLRPFPAVWLAAATAAGTLAAVRFLRHRADREAPSRDRDAPSRDREAPPPVRAQASPSAGGVNGTAPPPRTRVNGTPRQVARPARPDAAPDGGVRLLVDAVWRGDVRSAGDAELRGALAAARRNQVEGLLARAYPRQLARTLAEVDTRNERFRHNLDEVTDLLRAAGIPAVLIKADATGDHTYTNFDLVVPDGRWHAAGEVLADWSAHRSVYWLERSTKVLVHPPIGPAAHLHASVSWFGVPVVPTDGLFARAVPSPGHTWLVPGPADRLRIWLSHGLFQNLSLDLSELLAIRPLLRPAVVIEAGREAAREGWATGGRLALSTALDTIGRLDRGEPVELPVPLPLKTSLRVAAEHSRHLLRQGRTGTAAREAALRLPLVVAKRRRTDSS
ncbi:lipopolysaccharide biosynthesis protein [Streptomyces sp. TRM49041]|uniref:lipopolysaccharide biosynthesis protein n=1 Tax=Streptomyces sp. TRM49041 TaxID=2603216 RepID=UPI0011ECFC3F|nr:lipopolysaccharide biosynthesis protein [Streptomyces sp. TRM49041]